MHSLAIIVGHSKNKQGSSSYKGVSEYVFNSKIASMMTDLLKEYSDEVEWRIFYRDDVGIYGVAELVYEWKRDCDLTLELHFNSFKKPARGCEVLVNENASNIERCIFYADIITDELAKEYGIIQRNVTADHDGIRFVGEGDRGYKNLSVMQEATAKCSLLIEPCFANFETLEAKLIIDNPNRYAEFLVSAICDKLFRVEKNEVVVKIVPREMTKFEKICSNIKKTFNRLFS